MKIRFMIAIVWLLLPTICQAQYLDVKEIRDLYYQASQNSNSARALYQKLSHIDAQSEPLWLGYKGMANFMLAYHALNPYTKLKHFLEGKSLLDRAIERAPAQVELRYLRFTVQTNAPRFLGYYSEIFEDKALILDKMSQPKSESFDEDLYERIIAYMSHSRFCSRQEKKQLEGMEK